jgi:hypothetical protein
VLRTSTVTRQCRRPLEYFVLRLAVLGVLAILLSTASALSAQDLSRLAIPAVFVRELTPPGSGGGFLRPERIFVDNRFNEIFVSDPGYNRVVVFDTSGMYKFEFSGSEIFGFPSDVVVDSDGFIYVLGTTGSGKSIYLFDYDGLYLRKLDITGLSEGQKINIDHLAIDDANNLLIVDEAGAEIALVDGKGALLRHFPILVDIPEKDRKEAIYGTPCVADGLIYLPVSTIGSVMVYDLQGTLVREIGVQGTDVGSLNFPVAAAVAAGKLLLVLDKHRYTVVCYSLDGRLLGEFGGMGFDEGWFYHPGALAIDKQNRSYISQVYLNRVQVCALPDTIYERAKSLSVKSSQTESNSPLLKSALEKEVPSQLTYIEKKVN